jgi:hypothetical protein
LQLTATLWNEEIVDRDILFQDYWPDFKRLFDQLNKLAYPIQGLTKSEVLTQGINKAYAGMEELQNQQKVQASSEADGHKEQTSGV